VVAYDPKALGAAQSHLRGRLLGAESAEACVRQADLIVVMTPWPAFGSLAPAAFEKPGRRIAVVDCWRILPADVRRVADLVYIGRTEAVATANAV
jgi:predicted dinucleotide-binding enzyme